jgi:Do/DeqQ family serine protease
MSNVVQFRRTTAVLTLVAASIGGGLIAAYAVASHNSAPVAVVARADSKSDNQRVTQLSNSFADIIEKASPAVVKISSTRVIKASEQTGSNPFTSDPFFQQFFGGRGMQQPRDQRESGLGSGVLVSSSGYILTNNHVVDKSTTLKVELSDGRIFTGKIVGADPQTDVAVVKISADSLPVLPWGNSEAARVGDLCFAIGNPFGQDHTVTMGIVSAKGRSLEKGLRVQNFIQTDAAINPGNSGGALINAHGELIGMNTMILTGGNTGFGGEGGSIGIGFAVPSNMARQVFDQLVKSGKVSRGYMGVQLGDVKAEDVPFLGLKDGRGAVVSKVEKDSPGEKGGLKPLDIIVGIDGKTVANADELTMDVISHQPGETVTLEVIRNSKPVTMKITLAQRPAGLEAEKAAAGDDNSSNGDDNNDGSSATIRGIHVQALTSDLREQLNAAPSLKGVVITNVDADSPAADSVARGMVIVAVNREPVTSVQDFKRLINSAAGKAVMLTYNFNGQSGFTVVQPK